MVTQSINLDDLVALRAVAKQLGMTPAGVRNWGKSGVKVRGEIVKLSVFKVGGNWFTTKQNLQQFIATQAAHGQSTPATEWLDEQQQAEQQLKGSTGEGNTNRRRRVPRVRKPARATATAIHTEHESQ